MRREQFIASLTALLCIVSSCAKDFLPSDGEILSPEQETLLPKGTYASVPDIEFTTFDGSEASPTKVSINPSSLAFAWSEGDQIGVVPMDGATDQTNYTVKDVQGDARKCSFDGGAWSLKEGKSYCAYYPYRPSGGIVTSANNIMIVKDGQCQNANGDTSHMPRYLEMYAEPVTNTDGTVNFKFRHVSSIVNFIIDAPATACYTSIKVKAEEDIFAVGSFKLSDGTVAADGAKKDTFTMELNYFDVTEGYPISIFAAMFPWDYALPKTHNTLCVTLTDTEENEYVFSALFGNMEAGKGYQVHCYPSAKTTTFSSTTKFKNAIKETGVTTSSLKYIGIITGDDGGYTSEDKQLNADLSDEVPLYAIKINGSWVIIHTAAQKIQLPEDCSGLFSSFESLTSDGLEDWTSALIDASKVTQVGSMFSECSALTTVSLEFLKDCKAVTSVASMFNKCSSLTSADVSALAGKVSAVKSLSNLFYKCHSLKSIDLSGWSTPELQECERTFCDCSSLTSIDLTSLDTRKVTDMFLMMGGCDKVADVYLGSNFKFPEGSGTTRIFDNLGISSDNVDFNTTFHCNPEQWAKVQTLVKYPSDYRWAGAASLPDGKAFNASLPSGVTKVTFRVNADAIPGETEVFDNVFKSTSGNEITFRSAGGKFLLQSTDMSGMFKDRQHLTDISGLNQIDWTGVTDLSEMFSGCTALESCYLANTNLKGEALVNMSKMFLNCASLKSAFFPEEFNTSKVTDMSYLYAGSDIGNSSYYNRFDTSSLVDASYMFSGWRGGGYDTINLTSWNVRKVTNMEGMFKDADVKYVKTAGWNTSQLNNVKDMFRGCAKLMDASSLKLDITKVKDMSGMFCGCTSLQSADLSSLSGEIVSNMNEMFKGCAALNTINISRIDVKTSTSLDGTFDGCKKVGEFIVGKDFNINDAYATSTSTTFRDFGTGRKAAGLTRTCVDCPLSVWEIVLEPALKNRHGDISGLYYCKRIAMLPTGGIFNLKAQNITDSHLTNLKVIDFVLSATAREGELKISDDYTGADIYMSFDSTEGRLTVRTPGEKFYLNAIAGDEGTGGMFYNMKDLTRINGIENIDAREATCFRNLFYQCNSLPSLDLRSWDVSNVTDMSGMFLRCENLTSLDVSTWNTSKVTDMSGMFLGCHRLASLDVSAFDTSEVEDMNSMFRGCKSLKSIKLSSFNTKKCLDFRLMFSECESVLTLDLRSFDFSASLAHDIKENQSYRDLIFYYCKSLAMLVLSPSFEPRKLKADGSWGPLENYGGKESFTDMGIYNSKPYTSIYCTEAQWANIRDCMNANGQNPSNYSFEGPF